jgi:predicted unusual protein kinase regulating ubiquinone biosynthesis (AarF/ABC1/UbiB family)
LTTDRAVVTRARDHRERQIAEVLVRYGLSYLANVVGLERLVTAAHGAVGRAWADARTPPENLRLALEELGPTFIKVGQLLSTLAAVIHGLVQLATERRRRRPRLRRRSSERRASRAARR